MHDSFNPQVGNFQPALLGSFQPVLTIYASAVNQADVEDRELQEMHPGLHNPHAGKGM